MCIRDSYMGICVFGFFVRETWQFWVLAILVATSQGGIQALSRSCLLYTSRCV